MLAALVEDTAGDGLALAAAGGYGRGELWPHSDIDILVLTGPRSSVSPASVRGLLYPLWDAGWQVGHAVRTAKDAVTFAAGDLHAATSLLSVRFIAGERSYYDELLDRRARWSKRDRRQVVRRIVAALAERHAGAERAGWSLAPDLKDDIGGLRDAHVLAWVAAVSGAAGSDGDGLRPRIEAPYETLAAVREALHGELARKGDRIRIDLQPKVARRLGLTGAGGIDEMMEAVHSAARAIEHLTRRELQNISAAALGGPRRSGRREEIGPGIVLDDGYLRATPTDIAGVLDLVAAHARSGKPVAAPALEAAEAVVLGAETPLWDGSLRAAFLSILEGPHAAPALELLDDLGTWRVLLPEWEQVRGRAQHDVYHRYTVDAHSFLTVRELQRAIEEDTIALDARLGDEHGVLYLAALMHDIGKGSGEDHSVAGARLAEAAGGRMGLGEAGSRELAHLVLHHLLLPDTATRRDLSDGAVISQIASRVGTPQRLRALYALAIADGRATGPEAWTDWKAALVRSLYLKVLHALETGDVPQRVDVKGAAAEIEALDPQLAGRAAAILSSLPPSYIDSAPALTLADEVRLLSLPLGPGEIRTSIDDAAGDRTLVTVCLPDRPGTLARTAGVLTLHRVSVRSAQAFSTSSGMALERFDVATPEAPRWDEVIASLKAAYSGRLALDAHLERKAADYRPPGTIDPEIRVLQDEAEHSTVIEVRAPDALGLLYAIASGLSDLDLDIHVAKIDTLGERVVDVFYVRTPWGTKIDDRQAAEVERAIRHRFERLFG